MQLRKQAERMASLKLDISLAAYEANHNPHRPVSVRTVTHNPNPAGAAMLILSDYFIHRGPPTVERYSSCDSVS